MKFTIEISEDELRAAVQDNLKKIILNKAANWRTTDDIEKEINSQWKVTISAIVGSALCDVPALRAKVLEKIERKLTAQINMAMRVKDAEK